MAKQSSKKFEANKGRNTLTSKKTALLVLLLFFPVCGGLSGRGAKFKKRQQLSTVRVHDTLANRLSDRKRTKMVVNKLGEKVKKVLVSSTSLVTS